MRSRDHVNANYRQQSQAHNDRVIGNGLKRNKVHDAGLRKSIEDARRFYGKSIVCEYNSNDLNRMLGQKLNRKVSYAEKQAAAEALGFKMYEGSPRVPDHRLVVSVGKNRFQNIDLEHINPMTYNSVQIRARINSGAIISGLNPRQTATLGAVSKGSGHLPSLGQDSAMGRRVRDGPDVIAQLMGKSKKSK